MSIEINEEVALAMAFIEGTNRNVFVTGKAGTGKSSFLKELQSRTLKKLIVLAPTGVAAINVGGSTIHSVFAIPREPLTSDKYPLLDTIRFTAENRDLLNALELIVFDEASMIRADVLDAVDYLLRKVRGVDEPFGSIQVVFIGDMHQLSPIAKTEDLAILDTQYRSPFIIHARVYKQLELVYVQLVKVYRQSDSEFLNILESIRTASVTTTLLDKLNTFYKDVPSHQVLMTLTTHVRQAEEINEKNLQILSGEEVIISANIGGEFQPNQYPVAKELKLKTGAQVMLMRNDKGNDPQYYNGKVGKVASISNNKIIIEFKGFDRIEIEREIWVNSKLQIDNSSNRISTETLGTFEQFPIKLAWAITIHKSQGLTFDGAIIDAGNAFTAGQVYVAFSRLRSLNNVYLRSMITKDTIRVHPIAEQFEKLLTNYAADHNTLLVSERVYYKHLLVNLFDWQGLKDLLDTPVSLKADILSSSSVILLDEIKNAYNFQKVILQLDSNGDQLYSLTFRNRLSKARSHFENKLSPAINGLKEYIKLNKNDIHHKRNIPLAQKTVNAINSILRNLDRLDNLASLLLEDIRLGDALHSAHTIKTSGKRAKQLEVNQNTYTEKISLDLFQNGKSIDEITEIRKLNKQTIEYHLASFIKSGEVSLNDLINEDLMNKISPNLQGLKDLSLINLKRTFGNYLSMGQLAALRESIT